MRKGKIITLGIVIGLILLGVNLMVVRSFKLGMKFQQKATIDERFIREMGDFGALAELTDIQENVLNAKYSWDIDKENEKRKELVYKVAEEYFGTKAAKELKEKDKLEEFWTLMEYESNWGENPKNPKNK